VILRLRGRSDLGSTFMDVLMKYARSLAAADSQLMLVSANENMHDQLKVAGVADVVGNASIYTSDEWVGTTIKRAHEDAEALVAAKAGTVEPRNEAETPGPEPDEPGPTN
jgi:sulfate permease, SulP family